MDLEQALQNAPLFKGLEKKELKRIVKAVRLVQYDAGHVIIEEGSAGFGGMGVVLSGRCKITRDGQDVAEILPGQVFGEMSLIDERPRSATVTTLEPTQAAELSVWEFRAQIRESPELAINLLKSMSLKLRENGTPLDPVG